MSKEIDLEVLRQELKDFLDHVRDEYGENIIPCEQYYTVDRFIEKKSINDNKSES